MADHAFLNECMFRAASGGLSDFVVGSAVTGYFTPAQCTNPEVIDGITYAWRAESESNQQHELFLGAYDVATATIKRTTILQSSNGGAKVDFNAAPKVRQVLITQHVPFQASQALPIFNSGATDPFYGPPNFPNAFYVNDTNTTWVAWQSFDDLVRNDSITTFNHTTRTWSPQTIIVPDGLTGDDHGNPVIVRDDDGYVHAFYGSHVSPLKHAATDAPDDPSAWTTQANVVAVATYTQAWCVGGQLYLFYRGAARFGHIQSTAVVAGAVTWDTEVNITDTAADNVTPDVGGSAVSGTTIYTTFTLRGAVGIDVLNRYNAYVLLYNTLTGNTSNIDGSYVRGPTGANGAYPIDKTDLDAHYLAASSLQTESFQAPDCCFDTSGNFHLVYNDNAGVSTGPDILYHIMWNGSSWTTPHAVEGDAARLGGFTLSGVTGNKVRVLWSRGSDTERLIDVYQATRSAGGSWSDTEIVMQGESGSPVTDLNFWMVVTKVYNGLSEFRFLIGEFPFLQTGPTAFATLTYGNMRGWAWGETGFLPGNIVEKQFSALPAFPSGTLIGSETPWLAKWPAAAPINGGVLYNTNATGLLTTSDNFGFVDGDSLQLYNGNKLGISPTTSSSDLVFLEARASPPGFVIDGDDYVHDIAGSLQMSNYAGSGTTAGTGDGRAAFGNFSKLGQVTFAPGDTQGNQTTYSAPADVVINNFWSGDLDTGTYPFFDGLALYDGIKHTGSGNANYIGIDVESAITEDSTGPFGVAYGLQFFIQNFASGNIGNLIGAIGSAINSGTGTTTALEGGAFSADNPSHAACTDMAAVDAQLGVVTGATVARSVWARNLQLSGTATYVIGVDIEDHSGHGSSDSVNLWSEGSSSKNIIEGSMDFVEKSAPSAVANTARLYARDNGSGKTQLVVLFGSGAAQVLATEP